MHLRFALLLVSATIVTSSKLDQRARIEKAAALVTSFAERAGLSSEGPGHAALLALAGTSLFAMPLGALRLTPYKSLPQLEAMPGARRVLEKASPVGWVVAVEAPAFRFAPGLWQ